MLKYALLATAVTIAAPAMAQTTTSQPQASTQPTTTAPVQTTPGRSTMATDPAMTPAEQTAQTSPAQTAPAQTAATPQTTDSAAAQPAASGSQVAQVVNTEFPTYDKDSNGALNQTEFASWMVALKSASDPTTKADSAATKSWIAGAFAQADKDKSKSVSKDELTGFLSQGQS